MPEDALYMPSGLGTKVDLPKAGQKAFPPWKEVAGTFVFEPPMYPGPGYSMPWLAVTDGKRCLYWQAEQLNRAPLRFCISFDPGTKEIAVSAGQPLVFERLAGGWHAAAKTYRAMWNCAYKLASKTAAIREMTGFLLVILKQQNGEIIWPYTEFEELADRCEERGINWVGLFGWTRGGHDTLYPEYEPDEAMGGRAALEKGIALLQRRSIKVVLYANGQLQERGTTDYWRTLGKDARLVDEHGNPRGETWHKYSDAPAHHFDYACLSMPCWHEAMKKVARLAAELGADGLLYDQLGTTAPRTCFAKNHRHIPGEHVYAADRAELLDHVLAEARQINPQFLLLTEGLHDSLLSSVAAYHGWVKGTYPKQGIAFLDPNPPALDYPPFPFIFQYTFPELVCTVRIPTPLVPRDWANYAALIGMRHEIEIRYAPDRRYIRDGKKPRGEDYGTIRQKPDLASMLAEDASASRDYLKALTSLQRRFADIFYGGRFTDNEGFSCVATSAQVIAKSFTGENRMGVVVCNLGTESAQIDVKTDRCFVGAYEPEAGKVDPATPLAAKTLRVYVATADRKEYPYAFRAELETVHEQDMRDVSLKPAADECAFKDGTVIAIPEGAGEVLINAAKENKLDLFTMCNTGGHTWDFGTSPFLPTPYQWPKRWRTRADRVEAPPHARNLPRIVR